jgi:hypothetical protein
MKIAARTLASAGLLAVALFGAPAYADETILADLTTANALFQEGKALLDARRYAEACPKLELAQRLVAGIGVTLYLGDCYEQTGRLTPAWREFDKARTQAEAKHDPRARIARERADRLWPRLPKWTLVVSPSVDVPGLVVTADGAPVDHDAYGVERPTEAGTHRIRVIAPNRVPWETSVEVPATPGSLRIEIPRLAASMAGTVTPSTAPAPEQRESGASPSPTVERPDASPHVERSTRAHTQRVAGMAVFGLGVVGIGAGAVFGLQAKSQMDASNASGHCQANDHCDATGLAARSDALTKATLSTVGFVGGLACMAGGAVLFLTAPAEPPGIALVARPERGGASAVLEGHW